MANDSTSTSFVPAEASEGAPELTPRIVEASTIRDAMRAVLDQLGPDARIIATERLHRSGHDGLASQRFVRVTALPAREPRAPDHIEPKVDDVERSLVEVQGADDLQLVAQTAAEFSAVLRVELERRGLRLPTVGERDEVIAAGGDDRLREVRLGTLGVDTGESVDLRGGTSDASEPTLLACEPNPTKPVDGTTPSVASDGDVGWSMDALAALGLPYGVLSAIAADQPVTSVEWLQAMARAVHPYCAAPVIDQTVVFGPGAGELAEALGVQIEADSALCGVGSSQDAIAVTGELDPDFKPAWGRHLVLSQRAVPTLTTGSNEDLGLLDVAVDFVSVTEAASLPEALRRCHADNARCGFVVESGRAELLRPARVAALIASLL